MYGNERQRAKVDNGSDSDNDSECGVELSKSKRMESKPAEECVYNSCSSLCGVCFDTEGRWSWIGEGKTTPVDPLVPSVQSKRWSAWCVVGWLDWG